MNQGKEIKRGTAAGGGILAINNDGNRKAGYTAPSIQGQVEVITEAREISGKNPRSISMVEAHGTATPVGDPIEVSSLTKAFSQYKEDKQYCALALLKQT